ncbi:MAG: kynureninase, partial [Cyclobacteriaceae bacterium]
MEFENTLAFAQAQDEKDPLRSYRKEFHIPQIHGSETIYFCGHSLGLQPKSAKNYLEEELKGWATLGVEGHFHSNKRPWFYYHKFSKEALAKLVGSLPQEVVSMNGLTTNLHLMMLSFYRPQGKRNKIIVEAGAFPSDQYAFESQIKFHSLDPDQCLIELQPRDGEYLLHTDDILKSIAQHADELALVLLAGVQYYTGQFFDLGTITKAAREAGAQVGFDLAHAIGNVP